MGFSDIANNCRVSYKNFKAMFDALVTEQARVYKLYSVVLDGELRGAAEREGAAPGTVPALVRFVPCNGADISCFYCGEPTPVTPDTVRRTLKRNHLFPAYVIGCCPTCDKAIYSV